MNAIERAMDGAALKPLTNGQKRSLILLARKAFRHCKELGTVEETTRFEDWRHHQQLLALERESLLQATNEDFGFLEAHFMRLAGMVASAQRQMASVQTEPRVWALRKLENECRAAEDVIERPESYVASIARARFKTLEISSLGEKQLWALVFDIRRNAQRKRKSQRAEVRPPAPRQAGEHCGQEIRRPRSDIRQMRRIRRTNKEKRTNHAFVQFHAGV